MGQDLGWHAAHRMGPMRQSDSIAVTWVNFDRDDSDEGSGRNSVRGSGRGSGGGRIEVPIEAMAPGIPRPKRPSKARLPRRIGEIRDT